jgi:hypothetical protein
MKAVRSGQPPEGLSLSRWILLLLVLAALGVAERASGQPGNGGFGDAAVGQRA